MLGGDHGMVDVLLPDAESRWGWFGCSGILGVHGGLVISVSSVVGWWLGDSLVESASGVTIS